MKKEFPYVEIPDKLRRFIGDQDEGTRIFRRFGTENDYRVWYHAVARICKAGGLVSPGGAAGYARVSRAGLHKRLKEGRLTVFIFHEIKDSRLLKGRKSLVDGRLPSSGYVPISECKAWAADLEGKSIEEIEKEAMGDYDWKGKSLMAPPRRKWQRQVKIK